MILHPENLERIRSWQKRGLQVFYVNVWRDRHPNSPAVFYGKAEATREWAIESQHGAHPASYFVAYRVRVRLRSAAP